MTSTIVYSEMHLPPGPLPTPVVCEVLRLAFKEYRWFPPALSSCFGGAARLDPEAPDIDALLAHYEERRSVTIMDRMDRDFMAISSSKPGGHPFVGHITWALSVTDVNEMGWRDAHAWQMVELMRLVGAYLAQAGMADDVYRKKERFIPNPDGIGTEQTFTLRDPSEGLTGLMWRNFFGPPFIRMFGDRLQLLPLASQRELGTGLILVQPYELPTQAMTPEGDAAEERLITVLGPECFYDHQQHRKPTRVPELVPPST